MRRPYYNQWSLRHGDAALPDVSPDKQLCMAVYSVPATITAWTSMSSEETNQSTEQQKALLRKSPRLLAVLLILFVIFLLAFTSTLIAWGVLSDGFENHKGRKEDGVSDYDWLGGASNSQNKICVSDDCAHVAGDIVRYLDKTANPCQDFYQFACGKYPQEVVIPRDKDKTALFEAPINKTESASSRLMKQVYHLCMDTQSLQSWGLEPLKKAVTALGGWPASKEYGWNESDYNWERANAYLRTKYGVQALMIISVDSDWKNSSRRMITIDQPDAKELNIARAWRAAMARGKSLLHSALDSMVNLALEFGADRDTVIADMEEILLFEILLGNITLTQDSRRDRSRFYHPMSLAQLNQEVPEINWNILFESLLPPDLQISQNEAIFNVIDLQYLRRLPTVFSRFSKRTLANYHIYYLADNYVRYLAPNFRELRRSYGTRYLKTPATSSLGLTRWEECVDETASLLSWRPAGEVYANRNISAAAKGEVHLMFTHVLFAGMNMIKRIDWIDNSTAMAAINKLNHVTLKIPDSAHATNARVLIGPEYEGLNFDNTSYFDAVVLLNSLRSRLTFLSLRESNMDDIFWIDSITPAAVNAYFRFDKNEVVLPTALLQSPLFSPQVPRYVQYSRLGSITAHEVMHGYDQEGRQYDENGNLNQWWTAAAVEGYNHRLDCLIEQYRNITEHISGHQLNGKKTLAENFADNGGIKLAYDAYSLWKQEQKVEEERRLPGLASFTALQTFFLSFANVWCESIRPEALALFIDEDEYALGKYRVNVPLQNLPTFAEAFNCPVGTPMNPVKQCHFW